MKHRKKEGHVFGGLGKPPIRHVIKVVVLEIRYNSRIPVKALLSGIDMP